MTHTRNLLSAAALALALVGCDAKPTEEACDRAVLNIRKVTGQTHIEVDSDHRAAVRSCRAQSSRDTVDCYVDAQTKEQLFACGGELAEAVRQAEQQKKSAPPAPATPSGDGK